MNSISSYTVKHFEIGLSPIIEDTHTFANIMRGPKRAEGKPVASDVVDSSASRLRKGAPGIYSVTQCRWGVGQRHLEIIFFESNFRQILDKFL